MGNFNKDLTFGKSGENAIYDFLINHESTINVVDVSNDEWFQNFDIDFLHETKEGINKIEVKTDRIADKTHNMVYEVTSNKYTSSLGCFEKTEADFLFYYIINAKMLYIFYMSQLREWVNENKQNLKLIEIGDCALGYLIKLKDVEHISAKILLK